MINQIEHNEVKSSQISENEIVGSKDSSGTIIHAVIITKLFQTICPMILFGFKLFMLFLNFIISIARGNHSVYKVLVKAH